MQNQTQGQAGAGAYILSVEALTIQNARVVLEQGCAAIKAGQAVFDLGAVKAADSSAVAVLLAWQRHAHKAGLALSYRNLPAGVESLATLYGVDSLLVDAMSVNTANPAGELHRH